MISELTLAMTCGIGCASLAYLAGLAWPDARRPVLIAVTLLAVAMVSTVRVPKPTHIEPPPMPPPRAAAPLSVRTWATLAMDGPNLPEAMLNLLRRTG